MNNGYNFYRVPNYSYIRNIPIMPNYITPTPRVNSWFGKRSFINTTTPKITFSGILNGTSKTLGVINQAIPVFYQIKPIWNNAKTMIRIAKGLRNTETNQKKETINHHEQTKKEQQNAPRFFM